jgi:signal transduction histidine kinase
MDMKRILLGLIGVLALVSLLGQSFGATIELTTEELEWIDKHPVIRYAPDIRFGPIEYMDREGVVKGASIDYLEWISEHTGLNFEIVSYQNWSEIIDAAAEKNVDVIGAAWTEQRDDYLLFTEPFIAVPNVIITRTDYQADLTLEALSGKKVIVLENYAIQDYIETHYPEIELIPVLTLSEGLSRISLATDDYMAVSLAQASFLMKEKTITNLKVSGDTYYDNELSFGIRDDWSVLQGIMNKALDVMPESKREEIYSRWVHIETEPIISREAILAIVASLIVAIVIILSIAFFNRVLRERVAQKTQELEKLNNCLEEKVEQRTAELVEAEKMASLGRMVMGVSHQLNTPLGSSISAVSLIGKRQKEIRDLIEKGDLSKDAFIKYIVENERAVEIITKELNKAKELIQHFSELSSTIQEQDEILININKYLGNLIGSYTKRLAEKNINVIVYCDADLKVLISRVYLDNIFNNLINNSIRHGFKSYDSGQIIIRVNLEEDRIKINYKDNGIGIDHKLLPNIYEPLFTTTMGQTIGIGLNILYNTVVITLKGDLTLETDVGKGVDFNMSFRMEN